MKNILYVLATFILLISVELIVSCSSQPSVGPRVVQADSKELSAQPIKVEDKRIPLEVLGVYKTQGGNLYVYKFGTDTIYWAEGVSSSWPVSLQVK